MDRFQQNVQVREHHAADTANATRLPTFSLKVRLLDFSEGLIKDLTSKFKVDLIAALKQAGAEQTLIATQLEAEHANLRQALADTEAGCSVGSLLCLVLFQPWHTYPVPAC